MDKFIKYGGMKFEQKADTRQINNFVRNLPENERQSMYQTVNTLENAGLIEMLNQVTTIDDEMYDMQETE